MTSRQRVLAAARGGTPDVLPVALYNGNLDPVGHLLFGTVLTWSGRSVSASRKRLKEAAPNTFLTMPISPQGALSETEAPLGHPARA